MRKENDILGYPNLKIFQDNDFFSFSLDSIILANYSPIRFRDYKIIDFCTGNGVVPIILSQRCDKNIDAIEVQDKVFDLAKLSIQKNHLEERVHLYCMDVKDFAKDVNHLSQYDLVLCNPPYFKNLDSNSKNLSYEKMIARHEVMLSLDDLCRSVSLILKDNGNFCMVHRTERLMEILTIFRSYHIEPKSIKFIHEKENKESTLMLIVGQKAAKVGLKIEKPLIMYYNDGTMTEEYSKLQYEVLK